MAATVQVVAPVEGMAGSGVVIGSTGPLVYVLTANHLVSGATTLEIRAVDNRSSESEPLVFPSPEVIASASSADLALLRVPSLQWQPSALHVCPPDLVPRERGFPVVISGWSGEAPSCQSAEVENRLEVRKSPTVPPAWVWQVSAPQERGASGGAMVNAQGHLLGIASGTSDGKGYFTDVEAIQSFLRRSGLKWLYDDHWPQVPFEQSRIPGANH